jgi:hypothetical protein
MNWPDGYKKIEAILRNKILRQIKQVAVNQINQHGIKHGGVIA